MKRILSILISFTILLSFVSVQGITADELSTAVSPAYDTDGNVYYNVSVWYKFDTENKGDSIVIEMVKKATGFSSSLSDSDISYIDEAVIGSDGNVKFDFKIKQADEYTVRFTSNDFAVRSSLKKDIMLLSESEASDLIDEILDSSDVAQAIEDNAYELNLNLNYFINLNNTSEVVSELKNNRSEINITNFNSYFDEAVIFSYLSQISDTDSIAEMFEYYEDSYLGFDQESPANIYDTYMAMTDEDKGDVIKLLKEEDYSSFDGLRDAFNEAIILTALRNYDKTALDKVFKDNSDYVELSGYDKLSSADKNDILGELIDDSSITSVEKLKEKYEEYYEEITNPDDGDNGKGGGGGGVTSNVKVDQNLITPEGGLDRIDLKTDFTDLGNHEWAREAIEELARLEILSGKGNRLFCPGDNITREEFVKIMVLAFDLYGIDYTCDFTDVSTSDWFYTYVASGKEAGLIVGLDDGSYGVGRYITRQDMAVMVHRLLTKLLEMERVTDMSKEYDDMANVSNYAVNSVKILLNAGIMQGDNNMFYPLNNATRAEAAQLVYNMIHSVNN